jgi:16S rRNA (uracil1498-N3)-methyltransferase
MKLHRFIGSFDFSQKRLRIQDKRIVHQLRQVLRLTPEELILLGDSNNLEAQARIKSIRKSEVDVTIEKTFASTTEPNVRIILYCGILKRDNFELVAQKATEVGVSEIVPLVTARTVKRGLKTERLHTIIHEAAEQSGRGVVPRLHEAFSFTEALNYMASYPAAFFFDQRGTLYTDLASSVRTTSVAVALFIGPEGGWTDEEYTAAQQAGCHITSLGTRTLRAETAAIIASFLATARI